MVEYLVARDGVPFRKGLAFDYVLAGDGVYLAAENDDLQVRVPVADCNVRGLPPVYPACNLKHGRLPGGSGTRSSGRRTSVTCRVARCCWPSPTTRASATA